MVSASGVKGLTHSNLKHPKSAGRGKIYKSHSWMGIRVKGDIDVVNFCPVDFKSSFRKERIFCNFNALIRVIPVPLSRA